MQTHYLITHPLRGGWGRGETVEEALAAIDGVQGGERVLVYLADPKALADGAGLPHGRFHVFIGDGIVSREHDKVTMFLGGPTANVTNADTLAMHQIQTTLDGVEWNADTCDDIASLLRSHGYPIHSPEDI